MKGDPKDLKACVIDANLSTEGLSLYGFKLATSTMNYRQKNGAGDILFMRSFLYGLSGYDAATVSLIVLALGLCGLAASYLPARRAAGIDPVEALRTE